MAKESQLLLTRLQRRWKLVAALSAIATLLAAGFYELDLFGLGDAERGAYDSGLQAFTGDTRPTAEKTFWQRLTDRLKKKPELSQDIVILAIDNDTFLRVARHPWMFQQYGSWPYGRNVWANVLSVLRENGARAVVFDAVMEERSTNPADDRAMAKEIGQNAMPFYTGFSMSGSPRITPLPKVTAENRMPAIVQLSEPKLTEDDPFGENAGANPAEPALTPEQIAKALAFPVKTEGSFQLTTLDQPPEKMEDGGFKSFRTPVPPIEPLLEVVPGWGAVETEGDVDGKIRRTRFAYSDGANNYVTMSVAVAADLFGAKEVTLQPGKLQIGSHAFKINASDAAIDYGGALTDRFRTMSLYAVLSDVYDEAMIAEGKKKKEEFVRQITPKDVGGKIVFIAGFATGTYDVKSTPLEGATPGVVKHAAELDTLLHDRPFITDAPYWMSLLLALLVAAFSASLILVVRSTPLEIIWPVALFFGFFLLTGALVVYTKVHVLSAMPSLAGSMASVFATAVNHIFANKEAEHTREMLSRFMEPQLVEQMVEKGDVPVLGGENREVSAFFSDIRGFSGFTEKWRDDPQKLVKFLNQYLTRVTQVLFDHQGCVDKYIGDAVVCLFGAPFTDPEHARHACEAALAVRDEIDRMREEFRQQGLPDVYTRIGVNSDVMFVGNFGSEQIFDYTAMGDGMNLAARLEGANKNYESVVMIGENTYVRAKDFIEVRELDRVRVAGKTQPVAVYELLALKGQLKPEKRQLVTLYEQALALYRDARFEEAKKVLEEALTLEPADGPSKTLKKRCEKFMEQPPPMPFDGISNLEK
ncbi:MAG: CHASE2 domain-containing protein [Myxococcaceae bacterium]